MRPGSFKPNRLILAVAAIATLALVSWGFKQTPDQKPAGKQLTNDTIPSKSGTDRVKKVRDLDEALAELDNLNIDQQMAEAMEQATNALKQIDKEKLSREINQAMKEVDFSKIQSEINKALKEVDMDRIQREINDALKEVDTEKIQREVKNALKEVDMEKIQREIKESMSNIKWDELKVEMEKAKNINLDKMDLKLDEISKELEKIGPEIRKSMDKAKVEIEKAKTELRDYKSFVDGLNEDGLINKKENYSIKHADGELLINGKKASPKVVEKYSRFLGKYKNFSIKKDEDDFNIDRD